MDGYSTIKVSDDTKFRLKSLAVMDGESYEHIIRRLLDVKLNGQCIDYMISYEDLYSVRCVVNWGARRENILFYDDEGKLSKDIVYDFDDEDFGFFVGLVDDCDNLVNILAILDEDEEVMVGDLLLRRL